MAFNSANFYLLASGANGNLTFSYDAGSDAAATVAAAGYFNNADDDQNLTVDDMIVCQCSDGVVTLVVSSISSGSVTTRAVDETVVDTATTSANLPATGVSEITSTAAQTLTLSAPFKGARKVIFKSASSTAASAVGAGTGVTFDGTNDTATFNAAGECLELVGLSSTRWAIVNNTGSVGLA